MSQSCARKGSLARQLGSICFILPMQKNSRNKFACISNDCFCWCFFFRLGILVSLNRGAAQQNVRMLILFFFNVVYLGRSTYIQEKKSPVGLVGHEAGWRAIREWVSRVVSLVMVYTLVFFFLAQTKLFHWLLVTEKKQPS